MKYTKTGKEKTLKKQGKITLEKLTTFLPKRHKFSFLKLGFLSLNLSNSSFLHENTKVQFSCSKWHYIYTQSFFKQFSS